MAPIRQFVDGFNAADVNLAQAACMSENSIIDDFPPHTWTGPQATTTWLLNMARLSKVFGMSDPRVALQEPRYVEVSDQDACVVVGVDVRWLQNEAPEQRGGLLTVSLRDGADGWRIAAMAWTWD
jgi:hypothetical protein